MLQTAASWQPVPLGAVHNIAAPHGTESISPLHDCEGRAVFPGPRERISLTRSHCALENWTKRLVLELCRTRRENRLERSPMNQIMPNFKIIVEIPEGF